METIADLAARIGQPVEDVRAMAARLGYTDDSGTTTQQTLLWEDETAALAYYFQDPTPYEQWRNTNGAPDTPWSED